MGNKPEVPVFSLDETSRVVRFLVYYCRLFIVISAGLGLSSASNLQAGSIILFLGIALLFIGRLQKKAELFFIPDSLLMCLPFFWSMNAVNCFELWSGVFELFLVAGFLSSLFVFVYERKFFLPATPGLLQGTILAFISFVLFISFLRMVFPLFSPEIFRKLFVASLFFFGGIPVCITAGLGILVPAIQKIPLEKDAGPTGENSENK